VWFRNLDKLIHHANKVRLLTPKSYKLLMVTLSLQAAQLMKGFHCKSPSLAQLDMETDYHLHRTGASM